MSRTITSATGILAQFRTSVQKAGGKCTKYPHCIGEEIKSVITKCFAMRPGDVKIKRKKGHVTTLSWDFLVLIRSVDYSAIGEELSARKPQKLYVLFQCPRVGSFPGCTFLSPFLKASKYLPWTNLYQCTSRVCSLWQVHLQTLHPLWFLAFILEIAVLMRAGFVSLPNMTNNKFMRSDQDQKDQNNPALWTTGMNFFIV